MSRLSTRFRFLFSFVYGLRDNHVSAFAAATTLFVVISIFPFFLFLLTVTHYLPLTEAALLTFIESLLPQGIRASLISLLTDLISRSDRTFIIVTAATSLWTGSRGFLFIEQGLNSISHCTKWRNYFLRRTLSFVYTLLFAASLLGVLSLVLFGTSSASIRALLDGYSRTVILFPLMTLFFTLLYRFVPNRLTDTVTLRSELPGAILSAAGFFCYSSLYSLYITHLSDQLLLYGRLGAVMLSLLWLYVCLYLFFAGAWLNETLRSRPQGQLP